MLGGGCVVVWFQGFFFGRVSSSCGYQNFTDISQPYSNIPDDNEDFRKLAETEIASCEEEIAELKQQVRSPYKASVCLPFLN